MTNLLKYLTSYVIVAVVSFLLGYCCYSYINNSKDLATNNLPLATPSTNQIKEDTTVTVSSKTSKDDPDLIVQTKYTAKVNDKTVEVPVVEVTDNSLGTTATVSSTIDLTSVAHQIAKTEYKRNWEVSAGLGKTRHGDFYVPIGIQRNYNTDRAIEVSVGLAKDHVENLQVTHKWKF